MRRKAPDVERLMHQLPLEISKLSSAEKPNHAVTAAAIELQLQLSSDAERLLHGSPGNFPNSGFEELPSQRFYSVDNTVIKSVLKAVL